MKVGIRKPNLKKSLKARTTGKLKRKAKKAINPLYGKKGMGFVKNPKKAVYNKVYNKTTVDALAPLKSSKKKHSSSTVCKSSSTNRSKSSAREYQNTNSKPTTYYDKKHYTIVNGQAQIGNKFYDVDQLKKYKTPLIILGWIIIAVSFLIMPIGVITLVVGIISVSVGNKFSSAYKDLIETINKTEK